MKFQSRSFFSLRDLGAALTLVGALVVAPGAAQAHIKMSAPADWIVTNSSGDPQKITPCGVDSTTTYTATNAVTTLHVGDKVTFTWTETVPHDGHFRISLAINSRDELKDPAVTQMNTDGTAAAVAISTAYPVLADNLFPHTAASVSANKAYTTTVTIPNTPCTKCTLQLLQFMANHPLDPSYFYHQCADVTILAASGGGGSSGSGSGGSTGGSGGAAGKTGGTGGAAGKTGGTGGATAGTGAAAVAAARRVAPADRRAVPAVRRAAPAERSRALAARRAAPAARGGDRQRWQRAGQRRQRGDWQRRLRHRR